MDYFRCKTKQQNRIASSLGRLEISVNNLVCMEVAHAVCNLLSPIKKKTDRKFNVTPQHFVELTVRTVFHDDAKAGSLSAYAPESATTTYTLLSTIPDILMKCQTVQLAQGKRRTRSVGNLSSLLTYLNAMTLV